MKKPKLDMADIFRQYGHLLGPLNRAEQRVVNAITACRTAALGGNLYQCDSCGHSEQSYNSCRNRHCVKCQFAAKREWVEDRANELLPVPYYHVVFTIPHEFNELVLTNKKLIYNTLFKASSRAVKEVFRRRYKADPGMISVLHTWGQMLTLHPHIHMIIPSGGLDTKHGKWIAADEAFFLNVRALSRVFRAKFVKILRKEYFRGNLNFLEVNRHLEDCSAFYNLIDSTFKNDWNVYAKRPFHNALSVLKYLGGYTHRIAFANHRLISFDENNVTFRIKDRAAQKVGAQGTKTVTLSTKEFMRRFLMHVLPRGLQRIRHFGFLGSSCKEKSLALARSLLPDRITANSQSVAEMVAEFSASQSVSSDQCVSCKQGTMHPVTFLASSPELHIEQGVSNSS
jgi:hypothetical protein